MMERIKQQIHRILRTENDPIFKNVFRGSAVVLAARIGNAILLMGINLIIARLYRSDMVGVLALISSILVIASIFSQLGTTHSILRMVPEYTQKESDSAARTVIHKMALLIAIISPLISLFLVIGAFGWKYLFPDKPIQVTIFLVIALFLPFFSLSKLYTEALRALKKTRLYALAHLLPSLTNLILLVLLILLIKDPDLPLWAFFGSGMLVFFITWILVKRSEAPKHSAESPSTIPTIKEITSVSIPMGITSGMLLIIANFDILLLGFYRSETEIGIYSIASRLALLTGFIISSINAVSAPQYSELNYSDQKSKLLSLAIKSSRLIFWASFPILVILVIGGKFILGVFGQEFVVGYSILVVLVVKEFVNAIGGSVGLYLSMTGSHIIYRNIILIATVTNVLLNFLLIPLFGMIGAAIANLICVFFWNITGSLIIYRQTGKCISYIPTFIRKRLHI
jgi:O-antigen/teichoic acid export membrane protein